MLHGGADGALELRRQRGGSHRLSGRFPYRSTAVLSDGGRRGRPKKERFAPRAFAYRVDRPEEEIHLLVGHSFDRPLASRRNGTLEVEDGDDALTFSATITPEVAATSYGANALALIAAGLAIGLSPGFRIPPERAVSRDEAETVEDEGHNPEAGEHNALIRTIHAALLYELSIVTRPAYSESQVEMRSWTLSDTGRLHVPAKPGAYRWR